MEKGIDLSIIRTCTVCKEDKPLTDFGICTTRKYKYGRHSQCKKCKSKKEYSRVSATPEKRAKNNKRAKTWRENNPDRYKNIVFNSTWRSLGIPFTKEMYNQLLEKQKGVCAICQKVEIIKEKKIRLAVDHNHETNVVRGLLCGKCNRALGLLNDDSELLLKASLYLKNHG